VSAKSDVAAINKGSSFQFVRLISLILFSCTVAISGIADEVDLKDGKKILNDELRFSGPIKDIVYKCGHDGLCAMFFEDVAVEFGGITHRRPKHYGQVYWPGPYRGEEYKKYIGETAEVYCRIRENWDDTELWNDEWQILKKCSISNDPKFFIKVGEKKSADEEGDLTITTHIDPKTKKEYQEIKASFLVERAEMVSRSSMRRLFYFLHQIIGVPRSDFEYYGEVVFPKGVEYWVGDKLAGLEANIYCRAVSPNKIYVADHYCTLSGNKKYFMRFNE